MFYAFCGVESSSDKTKCIEDLCAVEPLSNGEAFEVVNDQDIWHPLWKKPVNHQVNGKFIIAVTDRVRENEEVRGLTYSQARTHGSSRGCVRRGTAGASSQMTNIRNR